ncbi:MAG: tRNA 2-selenouridine(34) synthase MnmH [Aquabacterium sp.]|uniref:tRNA 2-selenouridine(34) synthase MnmH n=1 Tax=Aquabacterium sp. TaxID=1872578 RepID=UPI0011F8BAC0|nr:tRNA 2-selenouridine(34) synthase MnmH [Aquabacterium sp.]TAK97104.1 MAG: tRNA 2-selenouridine(34) synthase MnmH [Aquabacterium sp.]
MSARGPVQVADRHLFDCLIDARSPSEFALDHIPGAINCPVLDDEERRIVGTIYKQQGAFEARRVGGAMVAANLARHLQGRFANMPPDWKPLVYCWRGGLRSGSMVAWWRLVGWDAQQLAGGYKRWRQHVIAQLDALCPQLQLHVVSGATGSAKTRVLHALAEQGAQVLDLEGLAAHKGSLLGAMPGVDQPSQKAFETAMATVIESFDLNKPVFVEAESRKIGRISLPTSLIERMRASPCLEIEASPEARLAFLLRDYAYLGDDGEALANKFESLRALHGKDTIARWQDWARQSQLSPLFAELTELHYDPLYARSQAAHFHRWAERQTVQVDALDEASIQQVARQLLTLI